MVNENFKGFVGVYLWIILVLCIIVGALLFGLQLEFNFLFGAMRWRFHWGWGSLGALIGAIVGVIQLFVFGGLASTLIATRESNAHMANTQEKILKNLEELVKLQKAAVSVNDSQIEKLETKPLVEPTNPSKLASGGVDLKKLFEVE